MAMILNIDITTDLESRLREEAARRGLDPGQYVVNALRDRLQAERPAGPRLTAEESRQLEQINQGLSQEEWARYYDLVKKRQRGKLGDDEYAELVAVSSRIEELNARRMECLAELARLRGISMPDLMEQLGILSPPVL